MTHHPQGEYWIVGWIDVEALSKLIRVDGDGDGAVVPLVLKLDSGRLDARLHRSRCFWTVQ